MRYRAAVLADVPALLALEMRSFRTDRLSRRQWRHHLARGHSWLRVATWRGALAGAVLVFFRHGSRQARVYSIAVDADARGLGIGGTLLAHAEREAARRGCTVMALEVRTSNRAAIALYERAGYGRGERVPSFYEDGADAWRYRKVLAEGGGVLSRTAAR